MTVTHKQIKKMWNGLLGTVELLQEWILSSSRLCPPTAGRSPPSMSSFIRKSGQCIDSRQKSHQWWMIQGQIQWTNQPQPPAKEGHYLLINQPHLPTKQGDENKGMNELSETTHKKKGRRSEQYVNHLQQLAKRDRKSWKSNWLTFTKISGWDISWWQAHTAATCTNMTEDYNWIGLHLSPPPFPHTPIPSNKQTNTNRHTHAYTHARTHARTQTEKRKRKNFWIHHH